LWLFWLLVGLGRLGLGRDRQVFAFWDMGHVLVGNIGQSQLNLTMQEQVRALIGVDLSYYPDLLIPYVAVWPDRIKSSLGIFSDWHYTNTPYIVGNVSILADGESDNINFALAQCLETLHSRTAAAWTKAFALRFVIHLMGDLHQPLHCIELYNSAHPSGVEGGNLFNVTYSSPRVSNLHSFFDSVGGLYLDSMPSPITENYIVRTQNDAVGIMSQFPVDLFPFLRNESVNLTAWIHESFQLGVDYAYNRIQEGANLTTMPGYVLDVRRMLRQQIALAGYRLANILRQSDLRMYGPLPVTIVSSVDEFSSREVGLLAGLSLMVTILPLATMLAYRRGYHKLAVSSLPDTRPLLGPV